MNTTINNQIRAKLETEAVLSRDINWRAEDDYLAIITDECDGDDYWAITITENNDYYDYDKDDYLAIITDDCDGEDYLATERNDDYYYDKDDYLAIITEESPGSSTARSRIKSKGSINCLVA